VTTHPSGEFESEAFWQQAAEACLIYATKRIRTRAWRCVEGSLPAGAKDAQDYVSEAMVLILRGERHRPATVSPIRFVLLVVRTLIDRDWTERENGTPHEFVDVLRAPHHASALRPLAFIDDAEIEAKLVARDCVEHFKAAVPEKCRTYVELLASDEVPSRRECARALGVHEKEIRSMDRVIRRLRPLWQGAPPRRSHSTVIPAKP
jgi:DNA-directed RNA polymerase specialized sigma24 family protein